MSKPVRIGNILVVFGDDDTPIEVRVSDILIDDHGNKMYICVTDKGEIINVHPDRVVKVN